MNSPDKSPPATKMFGFDVCDARGLMRKTPFSISEPPGQVAPGVVGGEVDRGPGQHLPS